MEDTYKKRIEEIQKYYQSKEYHELKALSERKTLLDIFRKSRSETIHSNMIAWCFENHEFNSTPEPSLLFLLRLIAFKANNLKSELQMNECSRLKLVNLWNDIISNNVKTIDIENVAIEESVKNSDNKGRSDIAIKFNVNKNDKFRLLIENKVDSKEHDDQCQHYVEYYDKDDIFTTIYIFLAPEEPKKPLSSNKFIKITYQDFLDAVLYKILKYKDMYSARTILYLDEYINTITSIRTGMNKILAMSEDTKKLLRDFFLNNRDLIIAAIDSVSEEDDEMKEMAKSVRNGTKKYTVTFPGEQPEIIVGHTALAVRIARYLADDMTSEELLSNYGSIKGYSGNTDFILKDPKKTGGKKRYSETKKPIVCKKDGCTVYCSNQWVTKKVEALKKLMKNKKNIVVT